MLNSQIALVLHDIVVLLPKKSKLSEVIARLSVNTDAFLNQLLVLGIFLSKVLKERFDVVVFYNLVSRMN